jgi:hypothetical protein
LGKGTLPLTNVVKYLKKNLKPCPKVLSKTLIK